MTWETGRPLGNNGDALLHEVFYSILAQLDIRVVEEPLQADIVAVPPNGALLDTYEFPRLVAERIAGLEHLPLYIFPSSAYFTVADPAELFHERSARTVWFMREANSLEHLTTKWGGSLSRANVELVLDHDVVASAGEELTGYFPIASGKSYLLVAARADREASTTALASSSTSPAASLPHRIAKAAWRALPANRLGTAVARRARASSSSVQAARLLDRVPEATWSELGLEQRTLSSLRRLSLDVSSPKLATYDEYKEIIAGAAAVVSDRLHVALPSALLGKPTVMLEAGYHKLGGVYERSLAHLPNVRYVSR
ncbi:polysaccharide pyruvyl transferase family protein [Georgenia satyanarayanai]|nr:polysaccharide pyruvyl transferase family protein [Georgenia satyanarayanai]